MSQSYLLALAATTKSIFQSSIHTISCIPSSFYISSTPDVPGKYTTKLYTISFTCSNSSSSTIILAQVSHRITLWGSNKTVFFILLPFSYRSIRSVLYGGFTRGLVQLDRVYLAIGDNRPKEQSWAMTTPY